MCDNPVQEKFLIMRFMLNSAATTPPYGGAEGAWARSLRLAVRVTPPESWLRGLPAHSCARLSQPSENSSALGSSTMPRLGAPTAQWPSNASGRQTQPADCAGKRWRRNSGWGTDAPSKDPLLVQL